METIALSNIFSNAHFFAINFAMTLWEMSGNMESVCDDFGEVLYELTLLKFEKKGTELNRENAKAEIEYMADVYLKVPQYRHALEELYKRYIYEKYSKR